MRLPLDAAGVAAATAACGDAAARWVGWVQAAEEHEARKTMSTLAYDTKARAACAAAAAGSLSARYGDAGAELAALDAGPVDAGNRGSAMNQAIHMYMHICEMHMHAKGPKPCAKPAALSLHQPTHDFICGQQVIGHRVLAVLNLPPYLWTRRPRPPSATRRRWT